MSNAAESFLGVSRSCSGRRWLERAADPRLIQALSQRTGCSEVVARVMAGRGIGLEEAESWLNPRLASALPDPNRLQDMDRACRRLAQAVTNKEQIAIFGDYDVDGATSSAVISRFLAALDCRPRLYVPDRLKEGYGPNAAAMSLLKREGVSLVITVDCGISAHEALTTARNEGLDVIVVDHHKAEAKLPPASAIVNPNRLDDDSGLGHLAAVGVAFLLMVGLNRVLREQGYFDKDRVEPDLMSLLDLVALGTVCDVVPLTGLNRVFVAQGLKVLGQRRNMGLAALSDVAAISERPDAYHLGFVLGPRVNAGGRVGEAGLGATLLSGYDQDAAQAMAQRLDGYNSERQAIEAEILEDALHKVETGQAGDKFLFVVGEGWHPGVIGIVASRLKERYQAPTLVIAVQDDIGKGSGRSIQGLDLGAAVIAARQQGLLVNGGGHAMAAGLTVAREQIDPLRDFLTTRISSHLDASTAVPKLLLDGALQPGGATRDLLDSVASCAPFGVGNPQPRFAFPSVTIAQPGIVGSDHVRCRVQGMDGKSVKAIAFRAAGTPLGDALLLRQAKPLHISGTIRPDSWAGGDAVQLIVEDAAIPDEQA